jgi:alpha-glucosidase (family GH31 glycosyl hydrolase)
MKATPHRKLSPRAATPRAAEQNIIRRGRARFTILTDRLIRLEWAEDERFEDRATLAAIRRDTPPVPFEVREDGRTLTIDTGAVKLIYVDTGNPFHRNNLRAEFAMNGKPVVWRFGMKDRGNLGGTMETLDEMDGAVGPRWVAIEQRDPDKPVLRVSDDGLRVFQGETETRAFPPGLLSRNGWAVVDDSESVVLDPDACGWHPWPVERPAGARRDLYLLAYGHDYRDALRDATRVFGSQPLPPRYAFGYWYSRYWAYTDSELEELVRQFDEAGVPLDVLVIDMDWHRPGWTGYSWDRGYFPDPKELLDWLKKRDLKVTLNLHPADGVFHTEDAFPAMCRAMGIDPASLPAPTASDRRLAVMQGADPETARRIPFDLCDPTYMRAYFQVLHHPREDEGVDFWWMDWQQGRLGSGMPNLRPLPWINQLHWDDQVARRPRRRPLIFSRYGGIGAGRMPVGFSGDTHITWASLAFQPRFTATAANVLFGYWSHDIGGHMSGIRSPELYTRWMQFGAFSPILRTHCTKDPTIEPRVFEYAEPYRRPMLDAIRLRYALVPYLYTEARKTERTGLSLCRPMYLEWPEEDAAYRCPDQYRFGDELIVAPVVSPCDERDEMAEIRVWLPEGDWFDMARGERLTGGFHRRRYLLSEIPVFARAGAVLPGQRPPRRLRAGSAEHLVFTILPGEGGSYTLYEDDGVSTAYRDGRFATLAVRHRRTRTGRSIVIGRLTGDYDGCLRRRDVEIRLAGSVPPSSIRVNGEAIPWSFRPTGRGWRYDGRAAETIVALTDVDLDAETKLDVREPRNADAGLVDGWKGLMTRLDAVRRYASQSSTPHPAHPDQNLAVRAAQTGNRISRAPARFEEERRALLGDLERLPAALRGFRAALLRRLHARPDAPGIQQLERASGILKTARREGLRHDPSRR